jgi:hypothetical protein
VRSPTPHFFVPLPSSPSPTHATATNDPPAVHRTTTHEATGAAGAACSRGTPFPPTTHPHTHPSLPSPPLPPAEGSPYVTYPRFEKKILALLDENEYEPPSEDLLLSAFRALDAHNNGWIKLEKFTELMTGMGADPMPDAAFKTMLALFGKGKEQDEDGNEFEVVYYESYAAMGTR